MSAPATVRERLKSNEELLDRMWIHLEARQLWIEAILDGQDHHDALANECAYVVDIQVELRRRGALK